MISKDTIIKLNKYLNIKMQSSYNYLNFENEARDLAFHGISAWFRNNHNQDMREYHQTFDYMHERLLKPEFVTIDVLDFEQAQLKCQDNKLKINQLQMKKIFELANENENIKTQYLEDLTKQVKLEKNLRFMVKFNEMHYNQNVRNDIYKHYAKRLENGEFSEVNLGLKILAKKILKPSSLSYYNKKLQ